jgi:DNA recombination protein RmuC
MQQIPFWTTVLALTIVVSVLAISIMRFVFRRRAEFVKQSLIEQRVEAARLEEQISAKNREIDRLEKEADNDARRFEELAVENKKLSIEIAELTTSLQNESQQSDERIKFLSDAKEQFSGAFELLANQILGNKTKQLDELNQGHLAPLLEPLQTKLKEFYDAAQNIHREQGLERTDLAGHLKDLKDLNRTLSEDAQNLALALKGSSKTQGNWGEMILERVLESSGLQKGREYDLRRTYQYEAGNRGQPDVVVNLPEDRHLVIDAKVSLNSYDQFIKSNDRIESEFAQRGHVESVRRHMKELSAKNYQDLYELNSLDFVVMFVPIEPAFAAAIAADPTLWEDALRKNVLLVSPSGLLFVLRTVGVLWRQEYQARNVREIAKRGSELYNKLCGFVDELDTVGLRLQQARNSFDEARKKLCTGQGNVIRQAEMLKELGVKPNKVLPTDLIDAALEQPSEVPPLVALAQSQESGSHIAESVSDEEIPF